MQDRMSLRNQKGGRCKKERRAKAQRRGERSRAAGDPCGYCPTKHGLQEREGELVLEKLKGGSCNLTAALPHPFAEL